MDKQEILHQINASENNRVKLAIVDIDGVVRGKIVHKDKFMSSIDGSSGFCDGGLWLGYGGSILRQCQSDRLAYWIPRRRVHPGPFYLQKNTLG